VRVQRPCGLRPLSGAGRCADGRAHPGRGGYSQAADADLGATPVPPTQRRSQLELNWWDGNAFEEYMAFWMT